MPFILAQAFGSNHTYLTPTFDRTMPHLERKVHNSTFPLAAAYRLKTLRRICTAYYWEFKRQLQRLCLLCNFGGQRNEFLTLVQLLPSICVGATLIRAWSIVSSESEPEFMSRDQPGTSSVQEWLKKASPAKSAPMAKCESTVAHISSTLKVLRTEVHPKNALYSGLGIARFLNGCFNWMTEQIITMEKLLFHHVHPFKTGCLGTRLDFQNPPNCLVSSFFWEAVKAFSGEFVCYFKSKKASKTL